MATARRVAHAADTRSAVLAAAENLFTDPGFAHATIDQIASRAGVTKGAVYHHFADKTSLFRVVVERLLHGVGERVGVAEAPQDGDVWDAVLAAYQARIDLVVTDDRYGRIIDQDAAAVLGVRDLDRLAVDIADAQLVPVIEAAVDAGVIRPVPPDRLARMMGALIGAACREIAASSDPGAARVEVGDTVDALLEGLRSA